MVPDARRPKTLTFGGVLRALMRPHPAGFTVARWWVLRGLGFVFLSAFYSYAFQLHGLIGPYGILPAENYLAAARDQLPAWERYFQVPTLFWWLGASNLSLTCIVMIGTVASLLLMANCVPRWSILVCTVSFLSIISVSSVFASYQSDGMLLEAGLLGWFLAPGGVRPGLGVRQPPARIARFMLVWEWFRIYFESGVVKWASGDPQWRDLSAMDHYYENGPLPTWIGWYVQHLPHAFHAAAAAATLAVELFLVWAAFLPRLFRLVVFAVTTALQIGIILTANYAFLNYLVLILGLLLVDDTSIRRLSAVLQRRWSKFRSPERKQSMRPLRRRAVLAVNGLLRQLTRALVCALHVRERSVSRAKDWAAYARVGALSILFYATLLRFPLMGVEALPWALKWPAAALEPFRFANGFGLFAVMTRQRYEIEFQGTYDGETYVPYPFRYKPQDTNKPPGIYAPYQPRFEWNLWFASLGNVRRNRWVPRAAAALLRAEPDVLKLFAFDPFRGKRPKAVRTVMYQYWFSDWHTQRTRGTYWKRQMLGFYAPTLHWQSNGTIGIMNQREADE
jgi:lipase maturation factor 1